MSTMSDESAKFDPNDVQATKGLAWLSYVGIFFIIPMITQKNSAYSRFHVNQGVALFIAAIVCYIVGYTLMIVLAFVLPMLSFVGSLICLIPVVFAIIGIVNALQGNAKRLPIIGNMQIVK